MEAAEHVQAEGTSSAVGGEIDVQAMFADFSTSITADIGKLFDAKMSEHVTKTSNIVGALQRQHTVKLKEIEER